MVVCFEMGDKRTRELMKRSEDGDEWMKCCVTVTFAESLIVAAGLCWLHTANQKV